MQLFHSKKIRLAEDIVHKGPQGHLSKFPSISKQIVSLFSSIYLRVIYYSKMEKLLDPQQYWKTWEGKANSGV